MYTYIDYENIYGRIMQFGKNKEIPIHRWYPFVEGYSGEFIKSIIDEQAKRPHFCLEPFSGSGTTPMELQKMGIICHSFEVNPFMHTLSSVKINFPKYNSQVIEKDIEFLKSVINSISDNDIKVNTEFKTLVEGEGKKKWNLDMNVYIAIEKIKNAIKRIDNKLYSNLYTIVLSSILLDSSNLYRNGKCLSYKKGWNEIKHSQNNVINKFFDTLTNIFLLDIKEVKCISDIDNSKYLYKGDSRVLISKKIEDDSIDLMITSPPYLNSRDYTDSYMLELRVLGYVNNHKDVTTLRKQTLRSHVQLKIDLVYNSKNCLLENTMDNLLENMKTASQWNEEIPNMIKAYFIDIEDILKEVYVKMKIGGRIYFNVSNSAYYNTLIDTINITSSIAEDIGFKVLEIRKARYLKTSPQQKQHIGKLLEGVIVLEK